MRKTAIKRQEKESGNHLKKLIRLFYNVIIVLTPIDSHIFEEKAHKFGSILLQIFTK